MSEVRIEKVTTRRDLKRFIRFPWKVYPGDPNWVPPLLAEMKAKLDRAKNPFFEHAEMDLFLARRGGRDHGTGRRDRRRATTTGSTERRWSFSAFMRA